MKRQDDLQKILEAIAKSGIKVEGDFVAQKNVEYEVVGVDAGGIGIQINGTCKKLTKTEEEIYTAIENLQKDKNDEGKFIMYDFDQWYAIFRVLSATPITIVPPSALANAEIIGAISEALTFDDFLSNNLFSGSLTM